MRSMSFRSIYLRSPAWNSLLQAAAGSAGAALLVAAAQAQVGAQAIPDARSKLPVATAVQGTSMHGYYDLIKARINHAVASNPPKVGGTPLKGSTIVKFGVTDSGDLDSVTTEQATSAAFAQYAVRLVSSLGPFEPFSPEMRKHADRIEVVTRIEY